MSKKIQLRIGAIKNETASIRILELYPIDGTLPAFTAGSHIDLHLRMGLVRSYSLLNSQSEVHRYIIGVALEPQSRGGSRQVHEDLSVGDVLTISEPRNHFPLLEVARESILIGGGIGITPMLSMANRLAALGRPWTLHYCARSRQAAAFLADLTPHGDHVRVRFDDEQASFLDMTALLTQSPGAHFYCCGPKPMMAAFIEATQAQGIPSERVHFEYFQPPVELRPQGGFEVELAKIGLVLEIPAGKTILRVLQEEGMDTTSSCEAGICGECQVQVLAGVPDHKDHVLSDAERASNKVMMICCSGSRSERLVLDL